MSETTYLDDNRERNGVPLASKLHRDVIQSVLEAVREAGAWLTENQPRASGAQKAGGTWLAVLPDLPGDHSSIDSTVQDRLQIALARLFPEARFIGEEQDNEPVPDGEQPLLLCDPLDGTLPYIRGLGYFAISLLVMHRYPTLAVIYLPAMHRWYAASFEPGPDWGRKAVFYAVREGPGGALEVTAQDPPRRAPAGPHRESYLWVSSDAHRRLDWSRFEGKLRSLGATATHLALLLDSQNWDPRAVAVTRARTHDIASGLVMAAAANLEIRDLGSSRTIAPEECIRECLATPGGRAPALLVGERGDAFASSISMLPKRS